MSPVCHAMCACIYFGIGWKGTVTVHWQPKWPPIHLAPISGCAMHCSGTHHPLCAPHMQGLLNQKLHRPPLEHCTRQVPPQSCCPPPSCPPLLSMVVCCPAPELATSVESKRGSASVCEVTRLTLTALAMQRKGASTSATEQMVGLLKIRQVQ
jgi:hypothetical protein